MFYFMISRIFITGDNLDFVKKIHQNLKSFNQQINIEFECAENLGAIQEKSDVTIVYINSSEKITASLQDYIDGNDISYVSANPHPSFLECALSVRCIADQRHLLELIDSESVSLGDLKNSIHVCEPHIRESSLFVFDLNAIRGSDVKNESFSYPSGLFSEDATQMFRYAGMNELNKAAVINNVTQNLLPLICQFIWYYAEAAAIRYPDHPYFENTVNEYIVNVDSLELSISFYKSKSSGRWWVKVPDIPENKWKSCSYEDYVDACNDELSPQLLNIISAVE